MLTENPKFCIFKLLKNQTTPESNRLKIATNAIKLAVILAMIITTLHDAIYYAKKEKILI